MFCHRPNFAKWDQREKIILLSHRLDLPVRYDFEADPQVAYIEVVGKEAL